MTKKEILIVDDDQSVTKMLTMLMETRGYLVKIAYSGKGALEKASGTTDLILLDMNLPDQDGLEVCRKLKENKATEYIPVIILTANSSPQDIIGGLYLGADDYLTKPFDYEELVARMEVVMRRGSLLQNGKGVEREDEIILELRKILKEELITPFFQPIFLIKSFKILGFEALSRPKSTKILTNPELLFKAAIQFGCYQDMEVLSWRKAVAYASKYIENEKLFLNCNPYFVEGPKFITVKSILKENNVEANKIILEITERSSVSDFKTFFQHLSHYRSHGFQFAVDDVGGGYASLETIVETKPEVVKIDQHIVHNLNKDKFRKSIVKFIVNFCRENNILSIAEGIETLEDLQTVVSLGVDAVQGYYLAKPAEHIDFKKIYSVDIERKINVNTS